MAGYTRQEDANIVTGSIIQDTHLDNEFDALEAAFDASSGHDHTGGAGLGPKIILTTGVSGTLPVANGGIGVGTLTDGGVLLGSGTSAVTAMGVLADGSIVVGDGATDPVALAAFTSSTGTLKHESGGIEANISAITTDQFLGGTSAGVIGIRTAAQVTTSLALTIGTNTQAWDANLDQIAALAPTADNFIVGNGSAWTLETPTNVKISLGLVIGTDVQAEDAVLTDLAALSEVAGDGRFIVSTGVGAFQYETGTVARTSIGLGTGNDAIFSSLTLTSDLAIAHGGTAASTAATAFANIKQAANETTTGVAELATQTETNTGTEDTRIVTPLKLKNSSNIQAQDDVLDDLAALSVTSGADQFIISTGVGAYQHTNVSNTRTVLGLDTTDTVTFGSLLLVTDLAIAQGGTAASTASGAFTNIKQNATDTIAGVAETATQAEQETATATDKIITPGRQHFHPSAAKGWVRGDLVGGDVASFNVSSITDTAAGDWTVNWATNFSSASYNVSGISFTNTTAFDAIMVVAVAAGTTRIINRNSAGAKGDPATGFFVAAFGDQ